MELFLFLLFISARILFHNSTDSRVRWTVGLRTLALSQQQPRNKVKKQQQQLQHYAPPAVRLRVVV